VIVTQTPLRLSLLGGNTDFPEYYRKYGGLVLTTAIDKYIYCIVNSRFDEKIYVNYSIKEIVDKVDDLKHELVREALKLLGITKGIEITFLSDVPSAGTGLGSSSSVTVGVLNALHNYLGDVVNASQLAEEAIKIEVEILKKPIGIQDQCIAAFGGLRHFDFNKDGSIGVERIDISESIREDFDNSLMLFYTGITRPSSSVLSSFNIGKNIGLLEVNKKLATDGIEALRMGNLRRFGILLSIYWEAKKKLNGKVSNDIIDSMYEKAIKAGAKGGKIIGAGGGGFLLLMVPDSKRTAVRRCLRRFRELPFRLERDGSKVIFNIRRY
jgi:D-glycero-alpha-D-manno-heptose-7-phosphate kinase